MASKQEVVTLLQNRRLMEAKNICRKLCKENGDDAESWFLLAGINAQMGMLDEVATCCRRVVALQPTNVQAHYNLGVALQMLGNHRDATNSYREVVRLQPDYAVAYANLGLALRELKFHQEAIESCQYAMQLQPEMAEARNTFGLIQMDQGKFDDASRCFEEIILANPNYAEAYHNLGLCNVYRNQLQEAVEMFRRALHIKPDYSDAYQGLGNVLQQLGDLDEALINFRQAVRYKPDSALAIGSLGVILASQGKLDEAIVHYRKVIELRPDSAEAYNNLGMALLDREVGDDHYTEAENCFREALRRKPDSPEIHRNIGAMYSEMGRYDEALSSFQRALELKPGSPDAIAGMGLLMERRGEFEAGFALVHPILECAPDNIDLALAFAALASHVDRRPEAVALLEGFVQQTNVTTRKTADAYFALGKLYDEMKDYGRAFVCYRQANSLEPGTFDESANRESFDSLINMYSPSKMASRVRATNRSKLPIFIVGMPRSGTSLVEQILASHPRVYGAGELRDIHKITSTLPSLLKTSVPYPQCVDQLTRKIVDSVAQRHLETLSSFSRQAQRVTDKMPHNFRSLGLIDQLFPSAHIIHITRDPIDNCLSIFFQRFNEHHGYATDLAHLGKYYREYRRLMAHWKDVLRIPILEVKYEDLVDKQESVSRSMVEFCGLDWDERCLRFHESKRVVTTLSYDQVRRPMYKKSVARWKKYEEFITEMRAELDR